ncbi:7435_t:CDS:2, partial [Gigaspora rosea]
MVSQKDLSQQEIEHEQSQSREHEMQIHTPVQNKRALAQKERRRRERLENIANQGSTSHQEIEPGQTLAQQERRCRERLESMINQRTSSLQKLEQGQLENSVNQRAVSQQKRQRCEATENSINRRYCTSNSNGEKQKFTGSNNVEITGNSARTHAFYPKYQQAYEILSQESNEITSKTDLSVLLHFNTATYRRHYNLPSLSEVAVILPGDESAPEAMRDLILRLCGGLLEHIHEGHSAYLPLHYMLFSTWRS